MAPEPNEAQGASSPEEQARHGLQPKGDAPHRSDAPGPADPYTAMPRFPARGGRLRLLLGAGLLAAGLLAGGLSLKRAPVPPPAPPAAGQLAAPAARQETFLVSMKDLDREATRQARQALLAQGAAQAGAAAPQAASRRIEEAAERGAERLRSSQGPREQAGTLLAPRLSALLSAAPQSARDGLVDGSVSLFTFRLIDFVAEDGDVVDIAVDGAVLARVTLSHSGAVLTLPLKPGQQHALTVTAVFDGGGGVTFGAQSSAGEIRTRVMSVGESDTRTIGFKAGESF